MRGRSFPPSSPSAGVAVGASGPTTATARAVYAEILRFGPRPRTELARRLALSGPTLTRVTRSLLDDGLLRELPPLMREKGRPQEPLDVDDDHARFLGLKITADTVFASLTTVRGVVHEELDQALPDAGPETVVRVAGQLARTLLDAHPRVAGIGVSLPAVVRDGRIVRSSRLLAWDEPVYLADAIEDVARIPVTVGNDMTALLHGISWSGIGRRYDTFAVVTIGAGSALGTVLDGVVLTGARGFAGITEAMPVVRRTGEFSTFGAVTRTSAVLTAAREVGAVDVDGGMPELVEAARQGSFVAIEVARDVAHAVAQVVASVVAVVDPEAVLLGGESAALLEVPEAGFEAAVRALVPTRQADLVLRQLPGDFDEWARGAASIAIRRFVTGE